QGKTRLIIATDPALLGVPFNALLTRMPPNSDVGYDLRAAPWMIRQWALSIALSRTTLLYQRSQPRLSRARKSLIGFGNPRFEGDLKVANFIEPHSIYDARGGARSDAVQSLRALPETEQELRGIKSYLGAGDGVLFLGDNATERNVRS